MTAIYDLFIIYQSKVTLQVLPFAWPFWKFTTPVTILFVTSVILDLQQPTIF